MSSSNSTSVFILVSSVCVLPGRGKKTDIQVWKGWSRLHTSDARVRHPDMSKCGPNPLDDDRYISAPPQLCLSEPFALCSPLTLNYFSLILQTSHCNRKHCKYLSLSLLHYPLGFAPAPITALLIGLRRISIDAWQLQDDFGVCWTQLVVLTIKSLVRVRVEQAAYLTPSVSSV